MKLRGKLLLVAILPLVLSLALIAYVLRQQQYGLAGRQQDLVQRWTADSIREELRHYVALALSTVSPYYNTGRDDAEIRRMAMHQLANLSYGADGYFFLYSYDGTVLMHPRQPELQGRMLMDMRDAKGLPAIRMMIDKARAGGGFVEYTWSKPSTRQQSPKLAYVTGLDRWGWMIGTGVYTDDLADVMAQLDRQIVANVDITMRWIMLSALASVAVIFVSFLLISINELRAADAKLTLLMRKLVRSQEEERAWLSRELHDGTSQTLVSVKLLTESALERLPPQDEGSLQPVLRRALERINQALGTVRGISHRLRPAELDTLGLTTALRQLGEEMCEPDHTEFAMQACDEPVGLPDEIKTTLFRVCQEALTNVRKHAGASRVQMALDADAAGLRLRIEDNGQGFDSEAVARHPRRGIGLSNMRERMSSIGGTLRLYSGPRGTVITAEVPPEAIARFAQVA